MAHRGAGFRLLVWVLMGVVGASLAGAAAGQTAAAPWRLPPNGRRVLLDSSQQEFRVNDINRETGVSCNFGCPDALATLQAAGYAVSTNLGSRPESLTPQYLASFGAVVMNGRYGGTDKPPLPGWLVDALAGYVSQGGSLLVVAGCGGEQRDAQFYNPLLSRFGIRFGENTRLSRDSAALAIAPQFGRVGTCHAVHGIPVTASGGAAIATFDGKPVIIGASYGRGRVIAAGMGSGFAGQGLSSGCHAPTPDGNKALLVLLMRILIGPNQ